MEPTAEPTGKKILIIEDEKFIAEIYARELTHAGFIVTTEGDGISGLETLSKDQFDLLLLDILLPNMHGLEVLRQWRAKNPTSKMIILLLTNLGQDDVIKEAYQLGAKSYLIKASYTPKQVVNEVYSALNGQATTGTPQTPPPAISQPPEVTQDINPTLPISVPNDQPIVIDQPTIPPVITQDNPDNNESK